MHRYADAAYLIIKFSFFDKFDLLKLFYDLIDANRVATAKLLLENQNHLKKKAIMLLSTPQHATVASGLVKENGLNPDDFPELQ